MKRKYPLFYIIYFSCIAFFIAAMIIFLIWLKGAIGRYNKTLPETASQEYFNAYFKAPDPEKLIAVSLFEISDFETKEHALKYISGKALNNTTMASVASQDSDTKKYIVKSGEEKIADFSLKKDGDSWTHDTTKLFIPTKQSVKVTALSDSTLYVNSKEVSEEYIISRFPFFAKEYLPEDVPCPEWITYEISGLIFPPEVKLIDRHGRQVELFENEGVLCEQLLYDPTENEVTDRILEGALLYARCMQNDAKKSEVYPYFDKNSDIYEKIKRVENTFVWDHNGYEFENVRVSEFLRYDENTVSVRISFIHVLKMYGREDYRNPCDITYFAHLVDGEYLIFNIFNN